MIFLTANILLKEDWITFVLMLMLILLVVVKLVYKHRLFDLTTLFISKHYFLVYGKDKELVNNTFNFILFIVQTLVFSLFFFLYFSFFMPEAIKGNSFYFYLKISVGLIGFFCLRYFLGLGLSLLFELKQRHTYLTFAKISYLYSVSVYIFPFLFFVIYIKKYNLLFFQCLTAVLAMLLAIRYIFLIRNNKKLILNKMFYFILYLCALEIAPILIISKLII